MHRMQALSLVLLVTTFLCGPACAENLGQLGLSYGKEFDKNSDISQYEIFWRHQLPYTKQGTDWKLATALEFGAAILDESGSDNSPTGRFSLMPQLHLGGDAFNFIIGLGAGFMAGETEFTDQNLGGSLFFSSKLGLQLLLGSRWGVEYTYYHQSNAGIYDYNASLNMNLLAVTFRF
jgi:hypothetical protein